MLVATPTLEMGIDIGDLSTVLLASLPRTVASYLQRVGRAGRLTGNALNLAFVTGRGREPAAARRPAVDHQRPGPPAGDLPERRGDPAAPVPRPPGRPLRPRRRDVRTRAGPPTSMRAADARILPRRPRRRSPRPSADAHLDAVPRHLRRPCRQSSRRRRLRLLGDPDRRAGHERPGRARVRRRAALGAGPWRSSTHRQTAIEHALPELRAAWPRCRQPRDDDKRAPGPPGRR